MRIVIDGRMLGPRWTGIGLYTSKLIENLATIDRDNEYIVLVDQENFQNWTPPGSNIKKVLAPYKIYSFSEQFILPFKIRQLKPDLVHFLHNVPILYRGKRVVIVHDTTMVDFDLAPKGLTKALKYKLKRQAMLLVFRATASANMVITPTQATKDRLLALLRGKLTADRITVVYEAIDVPDTKPRPISVDPPKLLYVGTFFPYKNLQLVIQAWPRILIKHPGASLTIIGDTPRFRESIHQAVRRLGVARSILLPGFVSNEEREKAYRTASLFIFPSLSEGFGLPPLEAMAGGLPVVAAEASCLPEVLGDGAVYFDPHDPKDLAEKVNDLLDHPEKLAKMQEQGYQRLGQFSWGKMATETLEVYKGLAKPD